MRSFERGRGGNAAKNNRKELMSKKWRLPTGTRKGRWEGRCSGTRSAQSFKSKRPSWSQGEEGTRKKGAEA